MNQADFIPKTFVASESSGKVSWKAPSNIALVKYWGKKPIQIPANPSLSFTLNACATTTSIVYGPKVNTAKDFSYEFVFENKPQPGFHTKIDAFLANVSEYLPFLKDFHLKIESSNSFPHSSGIASSASSMAAMALCLVSIEQELSSPMNSDEFFRKASFIARLGSGSACRSIQGSLVVWGKNEYVKGSTDLFGISYPMEVHQNFHSFYDTILLVHKGQKEVSSTVGHQLMHNHPFAVQRFKQAHANLKALTSILQDGDLNAFIDLVEQEALSLHAMMLTSNPSYILMKPNTLHIINKIRNYRAETGNPVCFTLDAGANVHVLYPQKNETEIFNFIKSELLEFCESGQYICDMIGNGAKKIE